MPNIYVYRLTNNYMLNFEGMYIWSIKNITSIGLHIRRLEF